MRNRKLATLALSATALAGVLAAAPAAQADTTVATFSLSGTSNTVTISVPTGDSTSPVAVASGQAGDATVSGQLGDITVTDNRAALVSSWSVSVSTTAFNLVGGDGSTASQTVAPAAISYASGAATTSGPGTGAFTPLATVTLAAPAQAGLWLGSGSKTVSWNPTMTFALLSGQIAGTYQGTVTHSLTVG